MLQPAEFRDIGWRIVVCRLHVGVLDIAPPIPSSRCDLGRQMVVFRVNWKQPLQSIVLRPASKCFCKWRLCEQDIGAFLMLTDADQEISDNS
ncbi:unnamed protein product [Dibothriocephalus latus]|uniref:Uncharacterized protein n=1 Tax=Dibothriocephalus latus TaxID=60516 RepID=A0A3P7NXF8_DIBLA|nr:unnamed protein product [Dibothriocephalus latus]